MRRLYAVIPAKVNLGLEVVRRREDSYHDLVTLFQAVSLFDLFVWTETGAPFEYVGPVGVAPDVDFVWRVLTAAPDIAGWTGRLRVVKRIPMAAGLGGGSADAALALRLVLPDADDAELSRRGAAIGADVPFFVRGGTALATGTGTDLVPIQTPFLWLVLVTPHVDIPEKTRALYSGLEPVDFSDGANVRDITTTLASGMGLPGNVPNAFSRQLLGYPVIRYAYDRLGQAGASLVSVSGAGPTLYALTASYHEAARIAARMIELDPRAGAVHVVRTVAARSANPSVEAIAAALRSR
ncbi:MAG: 4-(cytidine 5'-diphospho)-2-C-methyl-D-erythritol kinase [Chloroflexota bacterium]|nr:4-(cytidine 5'-diphospho)-2-C-methyl-D-erythritol kinase [Chloroflexota bacterium]